MGWEAIVADAMSEVRDDGMVDGSGYYCNNSATWRAPVRSAKPMPHVYPPATGRR
jgi:hypothetical protein